MAILKRKGLCKKNVFPTVGEVKVKHCGKEFVLVVGKTLQNEAWWEKLRQIKRLAPSFI